MARIQVLPLTPRTIGPATETPFVIIIDEAIEEDGQGGSAYGPALCQSIREETGAVAVFVSSGTLTVANVDEELHLAAQAAVERALNPERTVEVA